MSKKITHLLLLTIFYSFCAKAQNTGKKHFKPHFGISSNYGIVVPTNNFANKNTLGTTFGVVLEADLKSHLFTRFTWDNVQVNYSSQNTIGVNLIDVQTKNNANAFYLSLGYFSHIKKWRFYSFGGIGYAILNDPKFTVNVAGNTNYAYLSNQNTNSFMANYGAGIGYGFSANERIMIESSFTEMPVIVDNATYLSLQLVYKMIFRTQK